MRLNFYFIIKACKYIYFRYDKDIDFMSSIFDSVDMATSRRKTKVLKITNSRSLFSGDTVNTTSNIAYSEKPPEISQSHAVDIKDPLTPLFPALPLPSNPKVDIVWTIVLGAYRFLFRCSIFLCVLSFDP